MLTDTDQSDYDSDFQDVSDAECSDMEFDDKGVEIKKEEKKKEAPGKVCFIAVKKGVRWWNIIAIPLVPALVMIISTYLNA
jgi:hypothetical protein